jgi:branched-chain amino acid transport system permease protein
VVGGLLIGVIQNMVAGYADTWVGQQMKVGVAFIVIVGVLLVKPSGLFGTSKVERV